ncbi:MAG: type II toxin-antitoxin system HicA family toxin [Thermoanaerobaculales bacterium]|nr:type II toxin-antitoxin system HicA family toxin [Thermoanaerobaculales bacterium]
MTPKLPRDISGRQLAKTLSSLGYEVTRQSGSHLRLTTTVNGEHHITIPNHDPLKVGTLSGILREIANHLEMSVNDLSIRLFG